MFHGAISKLKLASQTDSSNSESINNATAEMPSSYISTIYNVIWLFITLLKGNAMSTTTLSFICAASQTKTTDKFYKLFLKPVRRIAMTSSASSKLKTACFCLSFSTKILGNFSTQSSSKCSMNKYHFLLKTRIYFDRGSLFTVSWQAAPSDENQCKPHDARVMRCWQGDDMLMAF